MNRSELLLGVASALAGTAVLFVVTGFVYNLVFVVLALPFGLAAYFLWFDATGRLRERMRERVRRRRERSRRRADRSGGRRGPTGEPDPEAARTRRREAARILGVEPDADAETVRRAYRERAKDAHPDADDGSEEAFKRVTEAYEILREAR